MLFTSLAYFCLFPTVFFVVLFPYLFMLVFFMFRPACLWSQLQKIGTVFTFVTLYDFSSWIFSYHKNFPCKTWSTKCMCFKKVLLLIFPPPLPSFRKQWLLTESSGFWVLLRETHEQWPLSPLYLRVCKLSAWAAKAKGDLPCLVCSVFVLCCTCG